MVNLKLTAFWFEVDLMKLNISEKLKKIVRNEENLSGLHYGDKIQKLRKLYDLSQSEFGNLLGLSKGQISSYEREISQPSLETIIKIAQYFNCAIEELTDIPIRNDFYLNWLLDQKVHKIRFQQDLDSKVEFEAKAGLITINFDEYIEYGVRLGIEEGAPSVVAANFLLLESNNSNVLIDHFDKIGPILESIKRKDILFGTSIKKIFSGKNILKDKNLLIEGSPWLVCLYIALEKKSWLCDPRCWPTEGRNILALRLSDGKIIRLHISSLSTGCQLYASYSADLEERINLWLSARDKKDLRPAAIEYALEWNKLLTESEITLHKKRIEDSEQLPKVFLANNDKA